MNRRTRSAVPLVALLVLAGCLGAAATQAGSRLDDPGNATQVAQPNSRDPVVLPYPEPPSALSADSAGAYAAAYEEIRLHNELLATVDATIDSVGTSCSVASAEAVGDTYRVVVECGHWYEFSSETGRGIADGAPIRASYLFGPDGLERTGEEFVASLAN